MGVPGRLSVTGCRELRFSCFWASTRNHVTAVEVVNDDDDDEGAVPLHRRGAHPEAWRMNGTLQTWRPIGKTGLTPENSEDEDEEDGLMIVAAAAPRE